MALRSVDDAARPTRMHVRASRPGAERIFLGAISPGAVERFVRSDVGQLNPLKLAAP
jgi:hypothetical protein